jgi:hypothetical protein
MEHGDLVALRDKLSDHARADEYRSADNEDATHRAILPPVRVIGHRRTIEGTMAALHESSARRGPQGCAERLGADKERGPASV